MSSIVSIVRSHFRDGALPLPCFYSFTAKTVIPDSLRGQCLTVESPEFEVPDSVFGMIDDSNAKQGDTLTIDSFYTKFVFEFKNKEWVMTKHWVRPK
jgi:hypothetical protein